MNKRFIGSFKEEAAINYLKEKDFRIIERNFKCKIGEIDIIAFKDNTVHFVEVKYRKDNTYGYASEAVSKTKQQKIGKCAIWYLAKKYNGNNVNICFDVIAIQGEEIEFIENAFGVI